MRRDLLPWLLFGPLAVIIGVAIFTRLWAWIFVGGIVTSWYRTPWRNSEVGGVPGSMHLLGWALDAIPPDAIYPLASKAFPIAIHEGDHIHMSWFRGFRL